jgi:hypothetical protein
MLGTTVQNVFATATWCPRCFRLWYSWWIRLAVSLIDKLNLQGFGSAVREERVDKW